LVVTNDQIQPPIIVQNRRNKHTFDTYAFTIDLFPLVFGKTCFAGHTFEIKWKINKTNQNRQSGKRNADSTTRRQEKAHSTAKSRPSTNMDAI
jgi:hypothetical protein